jgi:NADH:ubiquinone oxidoreductase subunit 2 (subunit N)
MGTTPEEKDPPAGVIRRIGGAVGFVTEEATDTAYGRRGAPAWPLLLIIIAGVAMFLSENNIAIVFGGLALIGLALWVGGRR